MLICEFGNEIQIIASVNNSSTQAITINETVNFNFRSVIGCLYELLLNVSIGTVGLLFTIVPSLPITIPAIFNVNKSGMCKREW